MNRPHLVLPIRWTLALAQLLICLASVWPMRHFLMFELSKSFGPVVSTGIVGSRPPVNLEIPTLTPEQLQIEEQTAKIRDVRMGVPVALDFPVLVAQVPFILLHTPKREWVPRGMFPDHWRAISWPFVGIFFWWCAGRGVEALLSTRSSCVTPRMTLLETLWAGVLFSIGLVSLVGIITSTPDDRRDIQFMFLIVGGCLWGVLSALTVTARILQWRIRKRAAVPAVD